MAKMNLLDALEAALTATKAYIDDNHYNQTEVDTLLALKQDASSALKLGTSSSTAFRGDQGLTAYNHSQAAHAPSNAQKNSDITKAEIEAKLTGQISSHSHAAQTTITGNAGSATKLQTARTLTVGQTGKAFDGTEDVSWSLSEIASGGNIDGRVTFTGTAADQNLRTRGIVGYDVGTATTGVLYLQYNANAPVHFGKDGSYTISADGSQYSGNAASATKVNKALSIQLNGGTAKTFDGSAAQSINITPSAIGASATGHTHNYAGSSSAGGAATSANKVNSNLVIKLNSGTTEGTNMFTFNGSSAKTINLTPDALGLSAAGHNHDDRYYTETEIDTKLTTMNGDINDAFEGYNNELQAEIERATIAEAKALTDAKAYADTKITALVNSAPDAMNTLGELAGAIADHQDVYDAYVAEMTTKLAGKADASHGTHVTYATATPKANGTAAVGTSAKVAREDHVHPVQTTVSGNAGSANKVNNALKVQLNSGTTEGTNQFTFDGSGAKTINITPSAIGASASNHSHSSYVNQNAFSNVKVGETTVAADTATDTLTLVAGSNVTITPDATNDKITIEAKDTIYTHPSSHDASMITQSASYRFVTDTEKSTWNAKASTAVATTSANGLMSKDMVTKLNGIATGAEVNQNAFANVKVGDVTVAADAKQDTLTFVAGSNITITPDATNDKITIAATDTKYTHPSHTAYNSGLYKITVNSLGHVTAATAVAKADITALGIPGSDTNTWRGIQNNLTSTATDQSLSAYQGKLLNDNKADKVDDAELNALLAEIFGTSTASEE